MSPDDTRLGLDRIFHEPGELWCGPIKAIYRTAAWYGDGLLIVAQDMTAHSATHDKVYSEPEVLHLRKFNTKAEAIRWVIKEADAWIERVKRRAGAEWRYIKRAKEEAKQAGEEST